MEALRARLLLALILLVALTGVVALRTHVARPPGPATVVRSYLDALSRGDVVAAGAAFDSLAGPAGTLVVPGSLPPGSRLTSPTVGAVQLGGSSTADVPVHYLLGGTPESEDLMLDKDRRGHWHLSGGPSFLDFDGEVPPPGSTVNGVPLPSGKTVLALPGTYTVEVPPTSAFVYHLGPQRVTTSTAAVSEATISVKPAAAARAVRLAQRYLRRCKVVKASLVNACGVDTSRISDYTKLSWRFTRTETFQVQYLSGSTVSVFARVSGTVAVTGTETVLVSPTTLDKLFGDNFTPHLETGVVTTDCDVDLAGDVDLSLAHPVFSTGS